LSDIEELIIGLTFIREAFDINNSYFMRHIYGSTIRQETKVNIGFKASYEKASSR